MTTTGIHTLINKANRGDGQACYELYQEYKNGEHVSADPKAAMDWLEKAIDCNHPQAQLTMGMNMLGDGNIRDAVNYLQLSINNHNADAMNVLGQVYLGNVRQVSEDIIDKDKGLHLLMQAAHAGSMVAMLTLGKICYTGKWVGKDRFAAICWLEKAAAAGSEEAQILLDEALREQTPYLN